MCGIAGFIDFKKNTSEGIAKEMIACLNHRGPDDTDVYLTENSTSSIGLCHARLSIIDLSNGGHQPMHYKHYTIVYNGEIYNYQEIKIELELLGHTFNTVSDTEVILHAYEEWGENAVNKFIGMFAYFIYDSILNKVLITRDRAGVKPFYYYWNNDLFLFSSELKSFHKHPGFEKVINQEALLSYFNYGYIKTPQTIFNNTHKLSPGHHLKIDIGTKQMVKEPYWQVESFYEKEKLNMSYADAKEKLHDLLISAVNYRMVADVPVGVFLSGGYDSTVVTALLQSERSEKIKTFTIGFEEGNNEAPYAKEIAQHFGTDHTEYIFTAAEAKEIIPTLPLYYDEPFADSSAIPTILVSKQARKKVTVALSADGGDEVFAGYNRYPILGNYLKKINKIPSFLKPTLSAGGVVAVNLLLKNKITAKHKLTGALKSLNSDPLKESATLFSYMNSVPEEFLNNLFSKNFNSTYDLFEINSKKLSDPMEAALIIDYKNYLIDDILTKVDRATMSVSLEGREPLLDHRIIEFAAQLPFNFKWDGKTSKKLLKDIVHDYIPKEKMDRPKTGFSIPLYSYLRSDLSYLIDEYLSYDAVSQSGLFNADWVVKHVNLFRENKLHNKSIIWKLLMFQLWYFKWMK